MFGKKEIGTITFYYNSKGLFDDISLMSAYMTKNLSNESGSTMDEFNISDDEEDMYKACIRQTLPNIYETTMKITSGVEDAFEDCVKVVSDETTESLTGLGLTRKAGDYIEITLQDNDAYNKNVLSLIDATLLNCLKYGILAEFYSICVNMDLYRIAQDKFMANLFQLKRRLFQLKKKAVSSQL